MNLTLLVKLVLVALLPMLGVLSYLILDVERPSVVRAPNKAERDLNRAAFSGMGKSFEAHK